MAQWKETLEPYVKVIEQVKTAPLNPTAGEDLIIGAVIISDAGPGTPTLISSLKDFLNTYAGADLTQKYTDSLDAYYTSDPGSNLASTMWLNAYRLSGSANLLVCRATKKGTGNYVKPLTMDTKHKNSEYIIKDTEILKKTNPFRLAIDTTHDDGWAIAIKDVGVFGNLITDNGPAYDFFADNIPDLVEQLNETSKFFSPDYKYYRLDLLNTETYEEVNVDSVDDDDKSQIVAVMFNEVYMAPEFLDKSWLSGLEKVGNTVSNDPNTKYDEPGYAYIIPTVSIKAGGNESGSESTPEETYKVYIGTIQKPGYDPENPDAEVPDSETYIESLTAADFISASEYTHDLTPGQAKTQQVSAKKDIFFALLPKTVALTNFLFISGGIVQRYPDQVSFVGQDDSDPIPEITVNGQQYYRCAFFMPGVTASDPLDYTVSVKAPGSSNNGGTAEPGAEIVITKDNLSQYSNSVADLNNDKYSGYKPYQWYATNVYNTSTSVKVRIRRFNHNACSPITTSNSSESPWSPNPLVIKSYTKYGKTPDSSILKYDFYEFAIYDPSINSDWLLFNVGNISGRGDITVAELNESLGMIQLNLPTDLLDLGLNYWDSTNKEDIFDDFVWTETEYTDNTGTVGSLTELYNLVTSGNQASKTYEELSEMVGQIYYVQDLEKYYTLQYNGEEEIQVDLAINPKHTSLLNVSDTDIMHAWDSIDEDERYIVEGLCDLGNTYSIIQNYMANMAVNSNYFYPISCTYSTNYLTIASKASKIVPDTNKIWFGGNYDMDDGTVGYRFNFGCSGMFWETVCRNRRNNNEFAGVFGQNTGIAQLVKLSKDFSKKERQLLLGYRRKINTVFHDLYIERYYWNDNQVGQSEQNVLSEECNTRLQIRISKAMPILLNQFKGRQNTSKTWAEVESVIDYWFKTVVLTYNYTIADYRILCSSIMTPELIRANKLNVMVQVRYNNSVKWITTYNLAYPIGVEFDDQL